MKPQVCTFPQTPTFSDPDVFQTKTEYESKMLSLEAPVLQFLMRRQSNQEISEMFSD